MVMERKQTVDATDVDCAYAAGLIDGEGCITILKRMPCGKALSPSYQVTVVVNMGDPEPIDFLWERWRGFRGSDKDKRTGYVSYRWQIQSHKAARFLEMVQPYLKHKRKQADIALEFHCLKKEARQGGRRRLADGVRAEYERCYLAIMATHQNVRRAKGRPRTRLL